MNALSRLTVVCCMVLSLSQPAVSGAQTELNTGAAELIKKIREEKSKVGSFQAFGIREQSGHYFAPDIPLRNGKPEVNDYSPVKFIYIAFHDDQERIAERKYTEEDKSKTERNDIAFFSTAAAKSVYHERSGFHIVRDLVGGRYVDESKRIIIGDPPQALGFYVPDERKWPDELLESGRYNIVRETKDSQYGRVIEVEGKKDDGTNILFSIAPEYSYRVVASTIVTKYLTTHWTLSKVVNVKGVWLPSQTSRVITSQKYPEPSTETWTLEKVSLNDVKEKDVRFQAVIGDHNHNMDNSRHSYTLGDNQRKYVTLTSESPTEMVKGWLYNASITVLLVLTVGAYVGWKRNQLAKLV